MFISGLSTLKGANSVLKNSPKVSIQHKSSFIAERLIRNTGNKNEQSGTSLNRQTLKTSKLSVKPSTVKIPNNLFKKTSDMKNDKFLAPKKEILSFEDYFKTYPERITSYEQFKINLDLLNVEESISRKYYENYLKIMYDSYKASFVKGPNPYALL
jgi:hypothetical protein